MARLRSRRDGPDLARLADLRGHRVAVDAEGSGTRVIALQLLADVGLDAASVEISPLRGAEAAAALREGRLDAAFFIVAANGPAVKSLFAASELRLLAIDRAAAYRLQHRFLSLLTCPKAPSIWRPTCRPPTRCCSRPPPIWW